MEVFEPKYQVQKQFEFVRLKGFAVAQFLMCQHGFGFKRPIGTQGIFLYNGARE